MAGLLCIVRLQEVTRKPPNYLSPKVRMIPVEATLALLGSVDALVSVPANQNPRFLDCFSPTHSD